MPEILQNPIVQSSLVPFGVALAAAALLFRVRLAGLAAAAGFFATVWLVGNFTLSPLTATRKIVLAGAAAPLVGALADLAFRPTRATAPALGALFGAAALWVFWTVLAQQPAGRLALWGAGALFATGCSVTLAVTLRDSPVRAGAAGLALGLGAGASAVLGASALLGQYGLALGAACGAFLLIVMILGPRVAAGVAFTLTFSALGALIAAGAVLLAQLPWSALGALVLVPLAVRLPLPQKSAAWAQAIVASLYAFVPVALACALTWYAGRGTAP
jgi:hypothetical protein